MKATVVFTVLAICCGSAMANGGLFSPSADTNNLFSSKTAGESPLFSKPALVANETLLFTEPKAVNKDKDRNTNKKQQGAANSENPDSSEPPKQGADDEPVFKY